jgi:dCMP deaminase
MPSGWDNVCEELGKSKPEVLHAEANAITKMARSSESCEDAVMFCTHTPCIECAKLIYQSGISKLYVKNDYVAAKGSGKAFLIDCGIELEKV